VLGLVDDIWYKWNGYIGITGPDKEEGGKYPAAAARLHRRSSGRLFRHSTIRPGSNWAWPVWRSLLVDGDPKPGVDLVKKSLKVYRLADASNPPKLNFVNISGKPFSMDALADYRFWELLDKVVQEEPTDSVDATTLGFWASLGIMRGRPFAPDDRMKKILTESCSRGRRNRPRRHVQVAGSRWVLVSG